MIDEKLDRAINLVAQYIPPQTWIDKKAVKTEALTAIYEIGLEVIGAAEPPIEPITTYREGYIDGKNALRLEQRNAWAKSCGVAEK